MNSDNSLIEINHNTNKNMYQRRLIKNELLKLSKFRSFSLKTKYENLAQLRSRVNFFSIFKIYDTIAILEDKNSNLEVEVKYLKEENQEIREKYKDLNQEVKDLKN